MTEYYGPIPAGARRMLDEYKHKRNPIVCAVCGEESGGVGTSMYGLVHKYGPVEHAFSATQIRKLA